MIFFLPETFTMSVDMSQSTTNYDFTLPILVAWIGNDFKSILQNVKICVFWDLNVNDVCI